MAFGALKRGIPLTLLHLSVKNGFVRARPYVTKVATHHRDSHSPIVSRVHLRHVVAGRASLIGVRPAFVTESSGRLAPSPSHQHDWVCYRNCRRRSRVEINARGRKLREGSKLVTRSAVRRLGRDVCVRRVAGEASGVSGQNGFERPLF